MLNHIGTLIIETDRLFLKPFAEEYACDMYNNWASDKLITKYLTWKEHDDEESIKNIINYWTNCYKKNDYYNWAILNKDNDVIGSINLMNIDNYNESCEIGFCLSRNFWNKGIMHEAIDKVLFFAFQYIGFKRVTARCHVENEPCRKLLLNANFQYEGTLRKVIKDKDGILIDCMYFSVLSDEFSAS